MLAGAFLILFLTRADAFLYGHELIGIRPALIFAAGAGLLMVCGIIFGASLTVLSRSAAVVLPYLAMVFISMASLTVNPPISLADAETPFWDFALFVFALGLGGLRIGTGTWRGIALSALVVTTAALVVDAFLPGTFSTTAYRAAGFAENPNGGAMIAVVLMASALRWEEARIATPDVVAMVLASVSVFFAQSRGGLISCVVCLFFFARHRIHRSSLSSLTAACVVAVFVFWLARERYIPLFSEDSARRDVFITWSRIDVEGSDRQREEAAAGSLRLALERPLAGWGNGYVASLPVGPHNMYLARWVDDGLFGLLAYLWLIAALGWTNYRRGNSRGVMLVCILAVSGFASHNLLEDRSIWLLIGQSTGCALLRRRL